MMSSLYTGMSGLLAYSRGLDVISSDVANLNTPGYKGNDLHFNDLYYRQQGEAMQLGGGVGADRTSTRFAQGEVRETGNGTDVAIDGNGFFVLRKDGQVFLTRAGRFEFDGQGYLVDPGTGARVAGLEGKGTLVDINISDRRVDPPQPTTEVRFINNVPTGAARHDINGVEVYDAAGERHVLRVSLINNSTNQPRSWHVEVRDEDGALIASNMEIRFQGNGSPEEDFNAVTFTFAPDDAPATDVTLFFGEPGSFTATTSFTGGTIGDVAMDRQDGYGPGGLINASFDQDGHLVLEYSNGQSHTHERLAIGWAEDIQSLQRGVSGLFQAAPGQTLIYQGAGNGSVGKIVPNSLEMSNVELTRQFTDLIVIQRGYQASSQMLTVANEMMQQLLEMSRKR